MIMFVAFGTHSNGRLWQKSRYWFDSILEACDCAETVPGMTGYYVVNIGYSEKTDSDHVDVVYSHNTEGYVCETHPIVVVVRAPSMINRSYRYV